MGNFWIAQFQGVASPLFVLWSISIEEQFYLLVPSVVKFAGVRTLRVLCWLVIAAAYGVLAFLGHRSTSQSHAVWNNSFVQFQFFGAGGLLAIHLRNRTLKVPGWLRMTTAAMGFAAFYAATVRFGILVRPSPTPSAYLLGYGSLLMGCVLIFLSFFDMMQKTIPVIT
jgi:peptidoglycan/LPS O-acetylase OafA/YrhL